MDRRVGLTALVIAAMAGLASAAGDPEVVILNAEQPEVRAPREGVQKRRVELREQRRGDREANKKVRIERKARRDSAGGRGGDEPVIVFDHRDDEDGPEGQPKVRVFTKKLDDGNVFFSGPGSDEGKARVEVFAKKLGGHGGVRGEGGGSHSFEWKSDDVEDGDVMIVGPGISGDSKKRVEVFAKKLGGHGAGPHSFEWKSNDGGGEPKVKIFRKSLKGGEGHGAPHAFEWHGDDEDHDGGPHFFERRGDDDHGEPGVHRFSFPGGEGRVIIRKGPSGSGRGKAEIEKEIIRGFGGGRGQGGEPRTFQFRVPGPDGRMGGGAEGGPEIRRFEMRIPEGVGRGGDGSDGGPRKHRIVIPREGGSAGGRGQGDVMFFRDGGDEDGEPRIQRFNFPGGEGQIMLFGEDDGDGPRVRVIGPERDGGEWLQKLPGGGEWRSERPDGQHKIIIRRQGPGAEGGQWMEGGDEGQPKIRIRKMDGDAGEWMPKARTRPIDFKDCNCV